MSASDPDRHPGGLVGSGGMLLLSREYVEEHGGDPRNLALHGRDSSGATWVPARRA